MAVTGTTVNEIGESILISLNSPYLNVREVLGFTDDVIGEDTANSFKKEFRWSKDNVIYSDYIDLTDPNLQALLLDPSNPFWIQYRYTVEALETGRTLTFVSISLEVETTAGTIEQVPQIECCDATAGDPCANLIIDCCGLEPWNPYQVQNNNYLQFSQIASDLFGFCVTYYKTAADQRSKDVILKEYSLFDVISSGEVKILIPDNDLPTKEIQFTSLGLDFPVIFEIHIVKTEFERVFGKGTHPAMRDYLYFPKMNRMYEVNSIAESDDFMYQSSYWRVALTKYQERTNVGFTDLNIEAEVESLTTGLEEEFGAEVVKEELDVRKPNQYNPIGTGSADYVRRILNKRLIIRDEKIYNNYTIISKYNYDLSTLDENDIALEYRYKDGFANTDNRTITLWFNPTYINPLSANSVISSFSDNGGKLQITTTSTTSLAVGNWVRLYGSSSQNGIKRIISIDSLTQFTVDSSYSTFTFNNPRFRTEKEVKFFVNEKNSFDQFSISYTPSALILTVNSNFYIYDLMDEGITLLNGSWYGLVVNLSNEFNQLSAFIWKTEDITTTNRNNRGKELVNIYENTKSISPVSILGDSDWILLGSQTKATNIRIFKDPVQIEEQSLILSQYVVKDTHLSLLVDNASPELRLSRVENPR
jgi:hypothetical protein